MGKLLRSVTSGPATRAKSHPSVRSIARKGLENLTETGLSTLYFALGRCTWLADDGGRDPIAPVLLILVESKLKGQDLTASDVRLAGEMEVKPLLLHAFNRDLNLPLTAETLLTQLGNR